MKSVARNDNLPPVPASRPGPGAARLAGLKAEVAAIEARGHRLSEPDGKTPGPVSLSRLVEARPDQGWMHEAWAEKPVDHVPAMAFLLNWLRDDGRPFLWVVSPTAVREHGLPYGPGLAAQGLDPGRFILVRPRKDQDALWALEEGLRSPALSAVVGEGLAMELAESRRLALVAKDHGTACFLLQRTARPAASATYSRWQVRAMPGAPDPHDARAPGPARLQARLVKHRGGYRPQTHDLEWQDATHHFRVAAPLADRPPAAETGASRHVG